MKYALFLLFAGLVTSTTTRAGDFPAAQSQTPDQQGSNDSVSNPAATPDASKRGYGSGSYGSESYGGRADVFVSAFWLFTSDATGNSVQQRATQTGGFSAGYRFNLNSWSALEGRYGFANNSQKYGIGSAVTSIPSYLSEITGSYIFKFHPFHRMQPFLEAGGGILHVRPGDYGVGSGSAGGGTGTSAPPPAAGGGSGGIGPYFVEPKTVTPLTAAAATSISLPSQTKPAFAYGAGIDLPAFSRFSIRLEYRGLAYKTPDFKQPGLKTDSFSFLSEPSFGVAFRF